MINNIWHYFLYLLSKRLAFLVILLNLITVTPSMAVPAQLAKITLTINKQLLNVEVANTAEQRQQGLMFRKKLAMGQGMLFDFKEEVMPCFWMKNTDIPLSIAYINSKFQITQISSLKPQDLTPVCSQIITRYALEVPQGWFEKQGITQGMFVQGITNHP